MGPALQLGIEAIRHVSVPSLLLLALALRFVLTIFTTLNVQLNYDDLPIDPPVHVHIELVDIDIVSIGFLLFAVHGVATIDTLLCLWDYLAKREKRQKIRDWVIWRNGCFILAATAVCSFSALIMFVFVRSKWTSNLCMVIQVLHLFPTLSVVSQALMNGILICLTPVLKTDQMLTHPSYNKAVTAHKVSNRIVVVYAVLNAAAAIAVPEPQNYFIILIPCCVLLELLCRFVLLYKLEKILQNAISTQAELAENENHPAQLVEANCIRVKQVNNENIATNHANRGITVTNHQAIALKTQSLKSRRNEQRLELSEKDVFKEENSDSDGSSISSYEGSDEHFPLSTKHSEIPDSKQSMKQVDLELYNRSKRLHTDVSTIRMFNKQAEVSER